MNRGDGFLTLLLQQQRRSPGGAGLPEGLEYAQGAIQALHEVGDLSDQEAAEWSRRFNDAAGYAPPSAGRMHGVGVTVSELSKRDAGNKVQPSQRPAPAGVVLFDLESFVKVLPVDLPTHYYRDGRIRLLSIDLYQQLSLVRWLFQPHFATEATEAEASSERPQRIRQLQRVSHLIPNFALTDNLGGRYQNSAARWHGFPVVLGETEFLPGIDDQASVLEVALGDAHFTIRLSTS